MHHECKVRVVFLAFYSRAQRARKWPLKRSRMLLGRYTDKVSLNLEGFVGIAKARVKRLLISLCYSRANERRMSVLKALFALTLFVLELKDAYAREKKGG